MFKNLIAVIKQKKLEEIGLTLIRIRTFRSSVINYTLSNVSIGINFEAKNLT